MDKLEEMRQQKAQIEARIHQLQSRDRTQRRKRENRARIVLGDAVRILALRDTDLLTTILIELPKLIPERDCKLVFDFLRNLSEE